MFRYVVCGNALIVQALTVQPGVGARRAARRRSDQAEALFHRLLGLRNDLGLLAEEYDTTARRQVGNVPEAFSHIALVNTALHVSGAGLRTDRTD